MGLIISDMLSLLKARFTINPIAEIKYHHPIKDISIFI